MRDSNPGVAFVASGEFQITSPPVVSRGVLVVGSAISDNVRVDAPLGIVRAFDARTGQPRWTFDPLVHDDIETGHSNVWAPMSVDEERGLVFLPTTSPSPVNLAGCSGHAVGHGRLATFKNSSMLSTGFCGPVSQCKPLI